MGEDEPGYVTEEDIERLKMLFTVDDSDQMHAKHSNILKLAAWVPALMHTIERLRGHRCAVGVRVTVAGVDRMVMIAPGTNTTVYMDAVRAINGVVEQVSVPVRVEAVSYIP